MTIEKRQWIASTLICCILCSVTLFVFSHRFVNGEVTPKWLGLMLAIGIMGIVWSIPYHKISLSTKPMLGTVVVFTLALSVQGILQYAGLISSGKSNFVVTGSFDNPAGFAAALACALPFCFLFFTNKKKYLRNAAIAAAGIMAITVCLSGSRAGMLALTVATALWLFARKIKNRRSKIIAAIVTLALPVVLYFFKKDSADGRLLIWRVSLDMVADKPILGHGTGAFKAQYMLYQAAYLNAHPGSRYAQLADNTLHPFNEYLLVLYEYGLTGLCVLGLSGYFLIRAYRRNRSDEKLPALMSLLVLAVFSFFSYPFRYPFTWVMLFLNVMVICNPGRDSTCRISLKSTMFRAVVFVLSTALLAYFALLTRAEIKWNRIALLSLAGKTREVLPEYDQLYRWFGKEGLFLYNHAAELHEVGEFERSIAVFRRCTRYYNDMDVQMLLADNYKELEKYAEAERHLQMAVTMCPARFMPLYELVKLYETTGRRDEALALAKIVMDKDVKIPSPTITAIKNEMLRLMEAMETSDNQTSDESENDERRQGETPEIQSQGNSALPP